MTEAQWLTCGDADSMLLFLRRNTCPWKWSTRKARLFACACCRRVWHLLSPVELEAIEAAETVADKGLLLKDLRGFGARLKPIRVGMMEMSFGGSGSMSDGKSGFYLDFNAVGELTCNPALHAVSPSPWGNPQGAANHSRALLHFKEGDTVSRREESIQTHLLRDVIGPSSAKRPQRASHRSSGNAVGLAQAIYTDLAFDRLPILADALEDAGCTDADILNHCRQRGEHCRGCWAVDLGLGRK